MVSLILYTDNIYTLYYSSFDRICSRSLSLLYGSLLLYRTAVSFKFLDNIHVTFPYRIYSVVIILYVTVRWAFLYTESVAGNYLKLCKREHSTLLSADHVTRTLGSLQLSWVELKVRRKSIAVYVGMHDEIFHFEYLKISSKFWNISRPSFEIFHEISNFHYKVTYNV